MKASIESASPHWDSFREKWTLECAARSAFRTTIVLGPKEWRSLLPQLRGRVRHSPVTEADAKFAASVVEDVLRTTSLVIDYSKQNVNVTNWGWKQKGLEKPTKEEKALSDKTDRRKCTIKCSISRGTRTASRCEWDVERIGKALMHGLVPVDPTGAELIIGSTVEQYVEREVETEVEQPDGTMKTVKKKTKVPIWSEQEQDVGPHDAELPKPGEHIRYIKEVEDLFRKAKGGRAFEVMDFGESELVLLIAEGVDTKLAKKWAGEAIERLPWVDDYKGAKLEAKAFEK